MFVSIIVPIYNVIDYLEKCIYSILEQTYSKYELLLIDDGSTDGSGELCDQFEKKYNRIHVFHKTNGGLSSARNYGLDKCKGDCVFFVDSDDYISPYTIEDLVNCMKKSQADIVECNYCNINENEIINWDKNRGDFKVKLFDHDNAINKILNYEGLCIVAWNKLYKKEVFDNLRYPEGKINEDEFLTPFLVDRVKTYARINNIYYAYVQRNGSIMNSSFSTKKFDVIQAHKERIEYFKDKVSQETFCDMLYHYYKQLLFLKKDAKNNKVDIVEEMYNLNENIKKLLHNDNLKINNKLKLFYYSYIKYRNIEG